MIEVEGREGAGENSNLEARKKVGNECLTTDRLSRATWYESSPALAGIQVYKKETVEGGFGDMGQGIDIFFRVRGIIVMFVDKAGSSSQMRRMR
jgi:hypothetical protein